MSHEQQRNGNVPGRAVPALARRRHFPRGLAKDMTNDVLTGAAAGGDRVLSSDCDGAEARTRHEGRTA
jgi:hypothetical protein